MDVEEARTAIGTLLLPGDEATRRRWADERVPDTRAWLFLLEVLESAVTTSLPILPR
ncbi:hypothetical protein AB0M54_32350 [Actinoplanes sp. NPDC051470]|uniref:hypothetical protein n=1 Tax=unclassified Actinoplanes TaxID=2626549 RepID=UPI00341EDCD0